MPSPTRTAPAATPTPTQARSPAVVTPAASTSTATATPSKTPRPPTPTATAALPSLRDFKNGAWLEQEDRRLADSIKRFGWLQDGIDTTESKAIQALLYIAVDSRAVTRSLVSLPWVQDGIEAVEAEAIDWTGNFASAEVASAVVSLGWMQDGIDAGEVTTIEELSYIANRDARVGLSLVSLDWVGDGLQGVEAEAINWIGNFGEAGVASAVVSLGWVQDGIDGAEVTTIEELSYIANRDARVGLSLVSLDWVGDGLDDAETEAINWFGNFGETEVASAVMALGWVQDGINAAEVTAIEELSYIANRDAQVSLSLVALGWVQDGVDGAEAEAINWIGNIRSSAAALPAISLSWVQDGIEGGEMTAIQELSYLTNRDAAAAERIVLMPFLESIEPADIAALESLRVLAAYDTQMLRNIVSHPTLHDGITDELAPLVATLEGVAKTNPGLAGAMLTPNGASLEERTITLPMAGDVTLAIIRTGPGAARSMDLLEDSVRSAEEFMGTPLPTKFVGLLFEEAVVGSFAGTNFGTHMAILPKYDVDDGSREAEFASQSIAHEVAHYYWSGNADWVDEGAAELMAAISESRRTGSPVGATSYPCAHAGSIVDLEGLEADRDAREFRCNYSLGERLFVDLYDALGDEKFREGFRNLYLASEVEDDADNRRGTSVGIGHLREAFRPLGEDAGTVIVRWYDGSEPHNLSRLDASPVDPSLQSINGKIEEAYVTTSDDGPPVSAFSAGAVSDWVYLTLKYSYDVSGDPREIELDIVEYYEDGFSFRRRSGSLTAEAKYIGGTSWFSVGASPTRKWATGRHFVYVYVDGRKVAEVEYEVTP